MQGLGRVPLLLVSLVFLELTVRMVRPLSRCLRELPRDGSRPPRPQARGSILAGITLGLITSIVGFAGLLRDGFDEDDPRRSDVVTILRAAERALVPLLI